MRLTVDGVTQTVEDWAVDYGIPCALIHYRLRQGWNADRAIKEPMVVRRGEKLAPYATIDSEPSAYLVETWRTSVSDLKDGQQIHSSAKISDLKKPNTRSNVATYTHNGITLTIAQWADYLGISKQAMHYRLKVNIAEAFTRRALR